MAAAARSAFWLLLAAVSGTVGSAFWAFPIPLPAAFALVALAALSFFRTHDALLLIAALLPVAGATHALTGLRYDSAALAEVAVLALLCGAFLRAARRQSIIVSNAFDAAVICFTAVAAGSCVAQLPTITAATIDPAAELWRVFRRGYFLHEAGYVALEQTALLMEGAVLAALVARTCRDAAMASRFSAMLVLGGTAAAALNVYRVFEVSLRNPPFLEALWQVLLSLRLNTQFGDLNAAGSLFSMIGIVAASRAEFHSRAGVLHAVALPVLLCALWISGSRVALAATVLCAIVVFTRRGVEGPLPKVRLRWLLPGAATLVVLGIVIVFLLPITRHGSFGFSINTRVELVKVGVRMMEDRPIFGVGTSRFYALFPRYTSDELQQAFEQANGRPIPRENAHNQFVQFGAELGLAGLIAFVLLLVAAFRAGLARQDRMPELAALAGFLITALAGHPLLTPLVSWPFWMMMGLVAAGGLPPPPTAMRRFAVATSIAAVVLVATMPLRWRLERREADLAGVRAGFSEWSRDENGTRFQLAARRSALFVARDARVVRIPLRSADGRQHRVDVMLDGHPASAIVVLPDRWVELVLPLPEDPDLPDYRRVDLIVADPSEHEEMLMVGRVLEPGE